MPLPDALERLWDEPGYSRPPTAHAPCPQPPFGELLPAGPDGLHAGPHGEPPLAPSPLERARQQQPATQRLRIAAGCLALLAPGVALRENGLTPRTAAGIALSMADELLAQHAARS